MAPGYPGVPGEPWGKDHTINQTEKAFIFLHDMIPGDVIGRHLPARPSILEGRVTLPHPSAPAEGGSEEWLENEGEGCDMYVREKGSLDGNEPRTSQVNILGGGGT